LTVRPADCCGIALNTGLFESDFDAKFSIALSSSSGSQV